MKYFFKYKYIILLFILMSVSPEAKSQSVGISDDTSFVPDPSSILDLGVGNKGFLLPRVELISVTDVVTVTNPAQGLIVFNTNATITGGAGIGFYYWSASKWNKILTEELEATGWQLTGNAGINPTIHYIGTTDNQPLSIRTNGIQRILVDSDGNVYITNNTGITGTLSVLNATNNNTFSTSSSQAVDIAYIFPLAQGTADSYLKNDGSGNLTWGTIAGANPAWELTGNSGTNPTTNFIGTTDAVDFVVKTNNVERMRIASDGAATTESTLSIADKLTVEASGADITGNTKVTGTVDITGNTGITGTLSVLNATNNNTFSTSSSQAVDIAYIFPLAQGTADSYLKNDGSGNLTWGTLSGSSNWTPKIGQARLETNDPDWGLVSGGGNAATRAVALGNQTQAQGSNSVALGNLTQATGYAATALGHQTTASGERSTAMGESTTASGYRTTAMGSYTTAASAFETVIGRYNSDYTPASTTGWDASDRLFVVGNGTSPSVYDKSDALIIYKNGNTDLFGNFSINNSTDFTNTFSTSSSQAVDIPYILPTTQGATNSYLKNDGSGSLSWVTIGGANPAWELTGNSGTNPTTNFIGTTDAQDMSIRTSSAERIRIAAAGNIGINEATPSQPLTIKGNVLLEPNGATASQLRFAVPSDTSKYTAFLAKTQKANAGQLVYTLPDSQAVAPLSVLGNDGTGNLSWTNMEKLAAFMYVPVYNVTTGYTITNNDYIILLQQDGTYTIPQATPSNKGKILYIIPDCSVYTGTNWEIIAAGGSLINCAASYRPSGQASGVMLVSDGAQWHILTTRRTN